MRANRLLLIALAGLAAGGCEREGPAENRNSIRLGYFANLTHAQAVLGVASGEFADAIAPMTLETRIFNAGPSLVEALLADEIEIGYIGPGPALNAYSRTRGEGICIIAGAAANGVAIVARAESGIRTLDDLRGRRIATPQLGNTQDISARHFLIHKLRQANADNVLAISNAEQATMMMRGEIDAAWAPEPWGARLMAECNATLIGEERDLWPERRFTLALVIASPRFLAEQPDVARKLLTVHTRWTQRCRTQPEVVMPQLGAALHALTGKKLPPGVLEAAIGRTEFTDEPLEASLRTFAQWAFELGVTRTAPKLDGLVDTKILRSIQVESAGE